MRNGTNHKSRLQTFITSLRVGVFLARKDILRANIWTTLLIVFVMTLTFLNLVVIGGILVGLIEGSVSAVRDRYSSDVIISPFNQKSYIEGSPRIVSMARGLPWTQSVTARYIEAGRIESGYQTRTRLNDLLDRAGGLVVGINPAEEDAVTGLSHLIVEGAYLAPDDVDQIIIGANLLFQYTPIVSPGLQTLKDVGVGSKVRLALNGIRREVTVKGIIKSKVGEVDQRIFMPERELRALIGRADYNVDEIAIKLKDRALADEAKQALTREGVGEVARIQTSEEAQPKFLNDVKATFAILGDIVGSIGLIVASITIFIIIFVNAITRRKFIGILKGIGVSSAAIEVSYILQSLFYAVIGTGIGLLILYGFLQPYIARHPLNFPFSDGILVATLGGTMLRVLILLVATVVAGYIPAKIVVRQNTLDAILGR